MPVYWLLGSDLVEQRILERVPERPDQSYARAVRALAERDFALTAKYLEPLAEKDPGEIGPLRAYAACRAATRAECVSAR
jgi:hypothetical protein